MDTVTRYYYLVSNKRIADLSELSDEGFSFRMILFNKQDPRYTLALIYLSMFETDNYLYLNSHEIQGLNQPEIIERGDYSMRGGFLKEQIPENEGESIAKALDRFIANMYNTTTSNENNESYKDVGDLALESIPIEELVDFETAKMIVQCQYDREIEPWAVMYTADHLFKEEEKVDLDFGGAGKTDFFSFSNNVGGQKPGPVERMGKDEFRIGRR